MTNPSIEERLTAYALGEIDPEEQAAIEKLLETDEAARTMLLEIRAAIGFSQEALKTQPSVALSPDRREAIEKAALSPRHAARLEGRRKPALRRLALAAALLLVFGGFGLYTWVGLPAALKGNLEIADSTLSDESAAIYNFRSQRLLVAAPESRTDSDGAVSNELGQASPQEFQEAFTRAPFSLAGSAQDSSVAGQVAPDGLVLGGERVDQLLGSAQREVELQSASASAAGASRGRVTQVQRLRTEIEEMKALPEGVDRAGIRSPELEPQPETSQVSKANEEIVKFYYKVVSGPESLQQMGAEPLGGGRGGLMGGPGGMRRAGSVTAIAAESAERVEALGYLGDGREKVSTRARVGGNASTSFSHALSSNDVAKPKAAPKTEAPYRTASAPEWRYRRHPVQPHTQGTETYVAFEDNGFVLVGNEPLSTFSIDVDTASYANMRRFLRQGQLPPGDAVRVEELINYFDYDYAGPTDETPFAAHMVVASAPWQPEHRLVRIGLKGAEMERSERPAANLVFLLDVSGSMRPENKLPLVKRAIGMLTEQLNGADRVAIVTYAGSSGVALPSTRGDRIDVILNAVEGLQAGGSTNGASGIELAYRIATENFIADGINRVILATDGDFNVGVTSRGDLERLIEEKARSGVFLTIAGFGIGNLKDATLETLSNKGNGNYAYIDTVQEARKVFVEDLMGTLVTIAKDVKIQVEFNPSQVVAYRLIGYENRALAPQDFNDDKKDAGEIGAGHTVTALYEIVPAGMTPPGPSVDSLRYREGTNNARAARPAPSTVPAGVQSEMLTLKLRYKEPEGSTSKLLTFHLTDPGTQLAVADADFKWAAAVACFGQMLRQSPHVADMDYNSVMALAEDGMAEDAHGYRAEFMDLLRSARPMLAPRYPISRTSLSVNLELRGIIRVAGQYRALIRSRAGDARYSVGDSFDSYRLLSIEPSTGCITVFAEQVGQRVQICMDSGSGVQSLGYAK